MSMSDPRRRLHFTIAVHITDMSSDNSHLYPMKDRINHLPPLRAITKQMDKEKEMQTIRRKALASYQSHTEWYEHYKLQREAVKADDL